MPVMQEGPLRTARTHDQADRDARDRALPVGASGAREVNAGPAECRGVWEMKGPGSKTRPKSESDRFCCRSRLLATGRLSRSVGSGLLCTDADVFTRALHH